MSDVSTCNDKCHIAFRPQICYDKGNIHLSGRLSGGYYEYHYNITGIRFYACGEYGSKSLRPHYHLIVFGLPIYDKQFLFKNSNGDSIYTSKTIEKTDTIIKTIPVYKDKLVNHLKWWQKSLMYIGVLVVIILLSIIGFKLYKLVRK